MGIDSTLEKIQAQLPRVTAEQAFAAARQPGCFLVDTRPQYQRAQAGEIPAAIVIERNHLEWRLDPASSAHIPEATSRHNRWIVICEAGYSSSLAAQSLRHIGLTQATDVINAAKWIHFEPEHGMMEVLDWAAHALSFTPRVVARVGQVDAAVRLAVEGVGFTVIPANAVPQDWNGHIRQSDPPLYRELTAYCRGALGQLTQRYVDLLTASQLPLASLDELPTAALIR